MDYRNDLLRLLELHEGRRHKPYRCTAGKLTIGVGFNLDDVGLDDEEIDFILKHRIAKIDSDLTLYVQSYKSLDYVRRMVLVDMAYNLGIKRLLGFTDTLKAIEAKDYAKAAAEMLNSKWARQVGSRATRLASMMKTGDSWEA